MVLDKPAETCVLVVKMATQKRGGGKPRKITDKLKLDIINGMAAGNSLLDMCERLGVERTGVWRARQADQEFDDAFERAACNGITVYLDVARNNLATASSRDDVLKFKELLRHAEWMAEKRLALYQPTQRQEITHNGPMVVGWKTIDGNATVLTNDRVNDRARLSTTADVVPALPGA